MYGPSLMRRIVARISVCKVGTGDEECAVRPHPRPELKLCLQKLIKYTTRFVNWSDDAPI